MSTTLLNVIWEDPDGNGHSGNRHFTKEEWQQRVDHMNSVDAEDAEVYLTGPGYIYISSPPNYIRTAYRLEEVATKGEEIGDFLDPLTVEGYERDPFDGDDDWD